MKEVSRQTGLCLEAEVGKSGLYLPDWKGYQSCLLQLPAIDSTQLACLC